MSVSSSFCETCDKCDLIIFSEWTPLEISTGSITEYQFKRKDYSLEGIIKAKTPKKSNEKTLDLFAEETEYSRTGMVKEYKIANWKEIRYATN